MVKEKPRAKVDRAKVKAGIGVAMEDEANATVLMADLQQLKENANHFFLVVMGAVILFMQAGFALIEVGTVRAKNATSILLKNISDLFFGEKLNAA